jgi:hypothetical protein
MLRLGGDFSSQNPVGTLLVQMGEQGWYANIRQARRRPY